MLMVKVLGRILNENLDLVRGGSIVFVFKLMLWGEVTLMMLLF